MSRFKGVPQEFTAEAAGPSYHRFQRQELDGPSVGSLRKIQDKTNSPFFEQTTCVSRSK